MVKQRILVTGGAGFIGSALCRYLVSKLNIEVVNADKLTYAASPGGLTGIEKSPLYRFVQLDICDAASVMALFEEVRPTAVIHLAAESHVDNSIAGPMQFIQTNVVGTTVLLSASLAYWKGMQEGKEAFRFVHVSTDEVYGSTSDYAFVEESIFDPSSPYSASKASADHLTMAWFKTYGLPVIVTHSSNNYGPFQHREKLIPRMISRALQGEALPVYGTGENIRDWLHVEDNVKALYQVLDQGKVGERYNVGGECECSNLQIVHRICDLLDEMHPRQSGSYREQITFVEDRLGHDFRYSVDCTKIKSELGWKREVDFEEGLKRTVAWYAAR